MSHYTAALVRDQAPFGMGGFVDRVLAVLSFVSDRGSTTPKADLSTSTPRADQAEERPWS